MANDALDQPAYERWLENVLRNEDGVGVRKAEVEAIATWDHIAEPSKEISVTPARVDLEEPLPDDLVEALARARRDLRH